MILLSLMTTLALGVDNAVPPEANRFAASQQVEPTATPPSPLDVFALVQIRATANNLVSTNPFLNGQVIGRLGGSNGVTVDPAGRALFTEQRVGSFFRWRPDVLDGKVGLSAAFEIDFAFGDSAYGNAGNAGGGFGGDQVNLQTRRLHVDMWPELGRHKTHIVAGLQFIGDGVNDPTATGPDGLLRSGGRLMVFGSEAAGVTVYGRIETPAGTPFRYRVGSYTLWENGLSLPDDAWLSMGDAQWSPTHQIDVGAHVWYLQDRTGGQGGALGLGPTSALSELLGGPRVELYDDRPRPDNAEILGDFVWLAGDVGFNADLNRGPVGLHGIVIGQVGRFYAPIAHDDTVAGLIINAEARYRYAPGKGSIVRAEVLRTSADTTDPFTYTGVFTGNSYGIAGALYATHGSYLLFPDVNAINRLTPIVADISGAGRGVLGLSGSVGYDLIPNRVNLRVGGAHASTTDPGESWGTEFNAAITWEPLPFFTLSTYGAYVNAGSAANLPTNPWAVYGQLSWLAF